MWCNFGFAGDCPEHKKELSLFAMFGNESLRIFDTAPIIRREDITTKARRKVCKRCAFSERGAKKWLGFHGCHRMDVNRSLWGITEIHDVGIQRI